MQKTRRPHPSAAGLALAALCVCLLPGAGRADGLRLGTNLAAMRFAADDGSVDVFFVTSSARVSRGRAALTLGVPVMGISGGSVALSDENIAVRPGETGGGTRFGLGDMSVALEYNLLQDRVRRLIVTLGGSLRFPTGSTAAGLGTGEHLLGMSLGATYGISERLLAYAELRHSWVGILVPTAARAKSGEMGLVYWLTPKMGLTGSVSAADYGGRSPASLDANFGLLLEVFPGFMMNTSLLGGLFGGGPQGGFACGFGFEI